MRPLPACPAGEEVRKAKVAVELLHLPDKPAGVERRLGRGMFSCRTSSPAGQAGRGRLARFSTKQVLSPFTKNPAALAIKRRSLMWTLCRAEWIKTWKRPANWVLASIVLGIVLITFAGLTLVGLSDGEDSSMATSAQQMMKFPHGFQVPLVVLT